MSPQSPWAPVVEDVRRALAPKGRAQLKQFPVEGIRLLERALKAGHPPRKLVISEKVLRAQEQRLRALLEQLEKVSCDVVPVPEGVLLELAEGRSGSGMFGLCDLPKGPSLIEIATRCGRGAGPVVVLVDVEEPGNVGALVRTALASGASGLVAVGVSDPFHPKAVRTSMGSLFKLPIIRSFEIEPVLDVLGENGVERVAAVSKNGEPPWDCPLAGSVALFLGNEARGLEPELAGKLDRALTVPMPNSVDSFSVNAAGAALLYEINRQRVAV